MSIALHLQEIKQQLPSEVQLVAVSKTKPVEAIQEAYEAGQRVFGENRIQEMQAKSEVLPKDIQWHMIGHVQDNKMKFMVDFVAMVHGMDKEKRLKALNKEAAKVNRRIDCLVQIHIAEEASKFGFDPEEAEQLFQKDLESLYPNLRICGLMGMATFTDDAEQVRREFQSLKGLFEKAKTLFSNKPYFNTLSMGMSGDYKLAVEEGSTMVRIGSSIFGARN